MNRTCILFALSVTLLGMAPAGGTTIRGRVLDKTGAGIAQATVTLQPAGIEVVTGSDGRFSFDPTASRNNHLVRKTAQPGQSRLSIRRNSLYCDFEKPTELQVTMFTVRGQVLGTAHHSIGAGHHTVLLPESGSNVAIYRVAAGGEVSLFRTASVGRQSAGSAPAVAGSNRAALVAEEPETDSGSTTYTIEVAREGYVDNTITINGNEEREIEIHPAESEGTVTDADGNVYQTVRIGDQVWMAQNLRTTKYNDGEPIPLVTDTAQWGNFNLFETVTTEGSIRGPNEPAPQFCYYNDTGDPDTIRRFGALYNWLAVATGKLAPAGWRVPDTSDWKQLRDYLVEYLPESDSLTDENLLAKTLAAGMYWNPSGMPGAVGNDYIINNGTGFAATPAGYRTGSSMILYLDAGEITYWWSRQEKYPNIIRCFTISNYGQTGQVFWNTVWPLEFGLSVRLIKD